MLHALPIKMTIQWLSDYHSWVRASANIFALGGRITGQSGKAGSGEDFLKFSDQSRRVGSSAKQPDTVQHGDKNTG